MTAKHAKNEDVPPPQGTDTLTDIAPEKEQPSGQDTLPQPKPHHRVWHWIVSHKKISIPVVVAIVLIVLVAVPFTRFALAGTVLKQSFSVKVIDQETHKPVSSVAVSLRGKKMLTDSKGMATFKIKVGPATIMVGKKYYKSTSQSVIIPILKQKHMAAVSIKATGRQVPILVTNVITKRPAANVKIDARGTEAKTNKDGKTVLVLPASETAAEATLSGPGFNTGKVTIKVTAAEAVNTFTVTPTGKIYFLSNLNGTLDVVKANLDGTERQTVLTGTGKEDKQNTVLLASRDWKFLALYSRRDGGQNSKLFLIDTSTDKTKVMDEGDASFTLTGWSDHRFVYTVTRNNVQVWQPNRQAIKSYNADTSQITTLDQTLAEGDQNNSANQTFGNVFIAKNQAVYTVYWTRNTISYFSPNLLTGKNNAIRSIQVNGQGKKDYKTFDAAQSGYINSRAYEPNSTQFAVSNAKGYDFYELEGGELKAVQLNEQDFFNGSGYTTYLQSPDESKTFWNEQRDGKNVLFIGDENGKGGTQIATLSDYITYGWYTNDYLLISKDSSKLFILPVNGLAGGQVPLKVTDYYKPALIIQGYGGGYGGL